jgi:hypothetical protein
MLPYAGLFGAEGYRVASKLPALALTRLVLLQLHVYAIGVRRSGNRAADV